jgi:hypothetical protein
MVHEAAVAAKNKLTLNHFASNLIEAIPVMKIPESYLVSYYTIAKPLGSFANIICLLFYADCSQDTLLKQYC